MGVPRRGGELCRLRSHVAPNVRSAIVVTFSEYQFLITSIC